MALLPVIRAGSAALVMDGPSAWAVIEACGLAARPSLDALHANGDWTRLVEDGDIAGDAAEHDDAG
jgi:hypothetical protein